MRKQEALLALASCSSHRSEVQEEKCGTTSIFLEILLISLHTSLTGLVRKMCTIPVARHFHLTVRFLRASFIDTWLWSGVSEWVSVSQCYFSAGEIHFKDYFIIYSAYLLDVQTLFKSPTPCTRGKVLDLISDQKNIENPNEKYLLSIFLTNLCSLDSWYEWNIFRITF